VIYKSIKEELKSIETFQAFPYFFTFLFMLKDICYNKIGPFGLKV